MSSNSIPAATCSAVVAGTTRAANGRPARSTAIERFAPFARPYGPRPIMERHPTPRAATGQMCVDHHHRRFRLNTTLDQPCLFMHRRQHQCPGAVARPAPELRPHPCPRPELGRQEPPLATGVRGVQHRINHMSQIRAVPRATLARRRQQRAQHLPLVVGQISRIRHPRSAVVTQNFLRLEMGHTLLAVAAVEQVLLGGFCHSCPRNPFVEDVGATYAGSFPKGKLH